MSPVRASLSTLLGLLAVRWLLACSQRLLTRLAPVLPEADAPVDAPDGAWPQQPREPRSVLAPLVQQIGQRVSRQRVKLRALKKRYQTWRNADPAELVKELSATTAALREGLARGGHAGTPMSSPTASPESHSRQTQSLESYGPAQDWTEQVRQRAAPFLRPEPGPGIDNVVPDPSPSSPSSAALSTPPVSAVPDSAHAHGGRGPGDHSPRQPAVIPLARHNQVQDAPTPATTDLPVSGDHVATADASPAPVAPPPHGPTPPESVAPSPVPMAAPISTSLSASNEHRSAPSLAPPSIASITAPRQTQSHPSRWPKLVSATHSAATLSDESAADKPSLWPSLPATPRQQQIDPTHIKRDLQRLESEHRGAPWNA